MENTIPDNLPEYSKADIKRTIDLAEFRESIQKDLKENPRYQAYFAQFDQFSIDSFISGFAIHKGFYITYADSYQRSKEEDVWGYHTRAENCLWEIQQKKLFDLQCRWRAGQIELPGIETTYDFMVWERNIKNCPFVDTITENEVELYCQYLQSCEEEEERWYYAWQDYSEIVEGYKSDEDDLDSVPEWYQFHNAYTGNSQLMALPDVKGDTEEFYLDLVREKNKQEQIAAGTYQPYVPVESLPRLSSYDDDQVADFIKKFGNKKELELFYNYRLSSKKQEQLEELENALSVLNSASETVAIEADTDWRTAILKAACKYKNAQTILAMGQVYEEYLIKKQMGVGYEYDNAMPGNWLNVVKTSILDGRVLNGEPRDFDY